jgi:hypothetical protein
MTATAQVITFRDFITRGSKQHSKCHAMSMVVVGLPVDDEFREAQFEGLIKKFGML